MAICILASTVILNDKEVSDITRAFIKRFAAVKASRLQIAVDSYKKSRSKMSTTVSETNTDYPSGNPYASHSMPHESPSVGFNMSPAKSNLKLDLSNSTASFFPARRGMTPSPLPSMDSFANMESYLTAAPKDNPYANKIKTSVPQFILAPPNFQPSTLLMNNQGRKVLKKSATTKKSTVSTPSFKPRQYHHPPEEIRAEMLFKTPKSSGDMWAKNKKSMELLKAPKADDVCSKESLMDGMPMPSRSLLHLDPSAAVIAGPENMASLTAAATITTRKPERSRASPRMLHEDLTEPPPFTTSVYELPPWPHIVRRLASSEQPAVSFMP